MYPPFGHRTRKPAGLKPSGPKRRLKRSLRAGVGLCLGLLFALPGQGQAQSAEWHSACGESSFRVLGAGINGMATHTLAIPGGAAADSIVVEVIGKGPVVPTTCTMSSAAESPVAVSGSPVSYVGAGTDLTTVFRHTMAAADAVTVSTDDSAHTWSVVAYVYEPAAGSMGHSGTHAETYLYHADWNASYPLAPAATPRDVQLTIPITDLDADGRVAVITATAGSVSQSITVDNNDAGSRLRIVDMTLPDVAAEADQVHVTVSSPVGWGGASPDGDSFIFGVGVQSRCDGDFTTICGDGMTVDLIGQGTYGTPTSTVTIPDPASVAYIVAEVVHKGPAGASSCTFSSDVDAPVTVSGTIVPPTGDGTETVTVFRHTLGAAGSVTIATDDPANTQSVLCYVFRNADGPAATGQFAHTYLLRDEWMHNFPLATASAPRNVRVSVPISELDGDGRYAEITVSSGGVIKTETLDLSTMGLNFNLAEVVLDDVPGWASNVYVKVASPPAIGSDPGGDSFVFGVVVQSECSTATVCDPPAFTGQNFVTPRSPVVYWEDVPGAIRYQVCGRKAGSSTWRCHTRYVPYKRFYNMQFGIPYELIVRVQCADGSISPYGPIDTLVAYAPREGMVAAEPLRVETYPNPASEFVTVERSNADVPAFVGLLDPSGRLVREAEFSPGVHNMRMQLGGLPAGMYLLEVAQGAETQRQRISIVR